MPDTADAVDLLVIGGGIQGACIARDAAGRGLSVVLCEKGDLAGATSSASSKLIHGGLRYLEHGEFKLVREALAEREVLLRTARHLVHPMRFVLPEVEGARPRWMVRIGLFLYDRLGGARTLPGSRAVRLRESAWGRGLREDWDRAFVYSDCFTDDARLVVVNARDAAARGARILVRTECVAAHREGDLWSVALADGSDPERRAVEVVRARAVVNAAGPWAGRLRAGALGGDARDPLRLVQGSHVVVPRLLPGDHALTLPQPDGRIVFVIPYGTRWSLVGTTETRLRDPEDAAPTEAEVAYLCEAVNRFTEAAMTPEDVVWSFAGVRPLYDDGRENASAVSREDVLDLADDDGRAPLLSVFGGKLTTARRVAERVVDELLPWFPDAAPAWTAHAALPGGDEHPAVVREELGRRLPDAPAASLDALVARHGADATRLVDAHGGTLGDEVAPGLHEAEVTWLVEREWARTADDVLWRRTKAGLGATLRQRAAVADLVARCASPSRAAPGADRGRR